MHSPPGIRTTDCSYLPAFSWKTYLKMLASCQIIPNSSRHSTSLPALVRPRSVLLEGKDQTTTINKNTKLSCNDESSPPKKRRLNEDDLIACEELGPDDDWEANDRFDVISHLGDGMYGVVYKAIDRSRDNEIVAVKKITFQLNDYDQIPTSIVREIANVRYLQRNCCNLPIIRLLDVIPSDGRYTHEMVLHMVFEYMEQDLDSFIRNTLPCGIEIQLLKDLFYQIVAGVEWMHFNNILHRDLKPQNILITNRTVKIADFGMSRFIDDNKTLSTEVVTQWYRSPEVLLGSKYSKAVDIWSLGCIFAEMISGRPLFASKRKGDKWQLEEILKVLGTPCKEDWPTETAIVIEQFSIYPIRSLSHHISVLSKLQEQLLSKMLQFKANKRICAHEIFHDDFFNNNNDSCVSSISSPITPLITHSISSQHSD